PDWLQRSIKTNNTSRCQYANSIAIAQNNDKELEAEVGYEGRVKANKNKNKPFKIESKDKIEVDKDVTKLEKKSDINGISIKSQALLYYQKLVGAAKTSHVNGIIKHRIAIKNDAKKNKNRPKDDEPKLGLKKEDSNGLYNLKLCLQNGASVIKEERVNRRLQDLSDNYPPSKNMNIRTNSAKLVFKNKSVNNYRSRDQIKRISLKKDVENHIKKKFNSSITVRYKISNDKDGKKHNKKRL
ncbi:24478_t:CDS:2, partial [Gigaspora margarita]